MRKIARLCHGFVSGLHYVVCVGPERPADEKGKVSRMTATAYDLLTDILSLCNEAPAEECPHFTLSHVTNVEGYREAEETMLADLGYALQAAPTPEILAEHVAHVLAVMVALGYAIGSGHAYESVLAAEIVVPDSLAGQDFLEAS